MGLPRVKFYIQNGGLNRLGEEVQKIPGFIITGVSVATKITIGVPEQIFSLAAAEDLGIEAVGVNDFAHKHLKDFYEEYGTDGECWVMLVSDATTYEGMADVNGTLAKALIDAANGAIRVLGLIKKTTGAEVITEGIDADVKLGVIKAQALADYYTEKYRPFRVVISGNLWSGVLADLLDFRTTDYRRVNMLLANNDGTGVASVGLSLGRLAKIPSQRKQSRKKDGNVVPLKAFFTNGAEVGTLIDQWDALHDKGYTFFVSHEGSAGFYFSSDQTLTALTDDYQSLARGFVIDETLLIAYQVMIENLDDEIPVTEAGKIHPAIIKSWQADIETQVKGLMTDQGKLSGFSAFIDENQNVFAADTVVVRLSPQPVGYASNIDIYLGFTTKTDN